jgi:hypothetical protein
MRWKEGFRCESCGSREYWTKPLRKLIICKECRKEVSALAGTMLSRSHLSAYTWYRIVRMVTCSPDKVVTAKSVCGEVGIGSYRTAWEALRKIRYAISVNQPKQKLEGTIELDEMVINGHGSEYRKISILGALEVEGKKMLSLRMIRNPDEMNIKNYFNNNFSKNVAVISDPEKLYISNWLELNRIKQISSAESYQRHFMNLHVILQDVRYGIRNGHHSVSEQYMQEGLDEYVFVFNNNSDRENACEKLLDYMVNTDISGYRSTKAKNKSFLSIIMGENSKGENEKAAGR